MHIDFVRLVREKKKVVTIYLSVVTQWKNRFYCKMISTIYIFFLVHLVFFFLRI